MQIIKVLLLSPFLLSQISYGAIAKDSPLDFRVQIDSACNAAKGGKETAGGLEVIAAQIAIKTVVGIASAILNDAAKEKIAILSGQAPGILYGATPNQTWEPSTENCIKFWYGKSSNESTNITNQPDNIDSVLKDRWQSLGLTEAPYVYGEVRIEHSQDSSALKLVPVQLYMSPSKEFQSIWRGSPSYLIAIDLYALGSREAFATQILNVSEMIKEPISMDEIALKGKSSGWFSRPLASLPASPALGTQVGYYTSKVVFTATMPPSKIAAIIGSALAEEKTNIISNLKPKTDSESSALYLSTSNAAFDALIQVDAAQQVLDKNSDASKKNELELKLKKAKFQADQALEAAGLQKRYGEKP